MKTAASRREDSVQFSLDALRRLELERIDQEQQQAVRDAADQRRRAEEVERLETERVRAEELRAEQAERQWQLRLDEQKRAADAQERRELELVQLDVERKRIELATRQAEAEVERVHSLRKPRGRWFSALLVIVALCAQAVTVYQLSRTKSRNSAVTAELMVANDKNADLSTRLDAALVRLELADQAPSDDTKVKKAPAVKAPEAKKPEAKKPKLKTPRVKTPTAKTPKSPEDERIHLNCDLTSPLGCARR